MFLNFLPIGLGQMIIYNRCNCLKETALRWSVQLQQNVGILEFNICSISFAKGCPAAWAMQWFYCFTETQIRISDPETCTNKSLGHLTSTCMATSFLILHLQVIVNFRRKCWNLTSFKFMGIPKSVDVSFSQVRTDMAPI